MDAKEIVTLVKALNKAQAAGEPGPAIVDILEKLKAGVKATEELLRATKVGVAVNRQKTHADPEVATLAREIVAKWREHVREVKPKTAGGSPKKSPKAGNSPAKDKTSSPESAAIVPLDKRTWKTDNVDPKRTDNDLRNNCIGLMYDGLACNSKESRTCVLKRALEIERACYNTYGPETKSEYKAKLRSLYQNLKNKSNPGLRVVVLSGEVSAELLVVMTSEQLRSPEQRQKDKELQKRNMEKAMTAQGEKSVSTYFECSKCHEKEVSYTQAQTRSADEPMTTFCECQNCGHHWKF